MRPGFIDLPFLILECLLLCISILYVGLSIFTIDGKNFANSRRPSVSDFKSFSWSIKHYFLSVGQNNIGNKIPLWILYLSLPELINYAFCIMHKYRITPIQYICWLLKWQVTNSIAPIIFHYMHSYSV